MIGFFMDSEHKKFVPLSFKCFDFELHLKILWGNNFPTIHTKETKYTFYRIE